MPLETENPYTRMQRDYYETTAHVMNEQNHRFHNANRDYWDILVSDTAVGFRDKVGLDFGCGCGRNVQNLWMRFRRMDGVDISEGNLGYARQNLVAAGAPPDAYRLHHCDGVDLRGIESAQYDFVMSTIVLQHIDVHEIRSNYFHEFFRIMRPGGLLSFQMGFGPGYGKAAYHENAYGATETNSLHDVVVEHPDQLRADLSAAGFTSFWHTLRPSFDDGHPQWIFVKAWKPLA
jgi:cyclopropane fatty-acyl-phospholipid synthase-like methyltransferase